MDKGYPRQSVCYLAASASEDGTLITLNRRIDANVDGPICGLYTVKSSLVIKLIGQLALVDADQLDASLRAWLALT